MDGRIEEKVTGIAILAALILIFILGLLMPSKNNPRSIATNDKRVTTLQTELKTAQTEAGVTPSP